MNKKSIRDWYEKEAIEQDWSVRTLDRNVSTLYYERLLMSQNTEPVVIEMQNKTAEFQANRLEFIKNPVIAEFLGVPQDKDYLESDLEGAIITNLQKFLMELGKGYAFVARQQRIKTDLDDYFIDLVFYNYILKALSQHSVDFADRQPARKSEEPLLAGRHQLNVVTEPFLNALFLSTLRQVRLRIRMWGKWICTSACMMSSSAERATTPLWALSYAPRRAIPSLDTPCFMIISSFLLQSISSICRVRMSYELK